MRLPWRIFAVAMVIGSGCQEKEFDLNNPENSFAIAKKPYNQGNYEIALNKLGEFKTRFPYSNFATEAELLIANAYFELGRYGEAVVSYEHFIKLHPKHQQVAYAQFRMGESYGKQAPAEIDREQELTAKAVVEWEKLLNNHPNSEYTSLAKEQINKGRRRIAESHEFIAGFYCRQKIWHACAHRNIALADAYAQAFPDLTKKSLSQAAYALEKLADSPALEDGKRDANLYVKALNRDELLHKAGQLREQANKL